jgi:YVTN family beta-propeller protein
MRRATALIFLSLLAVVLASCQSKAGGPAGSKSTAKTGAAASAEPANPAAVPDSPSSVSPERAAENPLPGMPPVTDPHDLYAADRPGMLSPVVRDFIPRVYVPNTQSHTVDVIDPATMKVVDHFSVGRQP